MYNDENIKKLVEDAIKNMDPNGEFFKNVVPQITEQIKNEQKKTEQDKKDKSNILDRIHDLKKNVKLPKDTKMVIHDLNKNVDTYLKNNKSLEDYISNRDKFMGVFNKITEDKIAQDLKNKNKLFSTEVEDIWNHCDDSDYCDECECAEECKKDISNNAANNVSYTSYTSGLKQTINKDGNLVGHLYFNINSNSETPDIYKQILDYYSILTLHADEWANWDHDEDDIDLKFNSLSLLTDNYTYHFEDDEREIIDSEEDDITSFIYTKLDDDFKMFSIYMLNYSGRTNKLYDFSRFIITLPEEVNEPDYENFYINLEKYFSDMGNIKNFLDDYIYTYINKFKVNHYFTVHDFENAIEHIRIDALEQIKDKINSESKKVEFKKEDPIDKTNSILDKLGIPHDDNGNVEIPITDGYGMIPDKFISNRMNTMDHAFDFLKDFFDCDKDKEADKSFIECNIINTGNEDYNKFLSKAINDGYIKVEILSPSHVYLNINGTNIFMNNPYGSF